MDDQVKQAIDKLSDKNTFEAAKTDGKICPQCGVIQGRRRILSWKDFMKKLYCRHTIECINQKHKDELLRIIRMAHGN